MAAERRAPAVYRDGPLQTVRGERVAPGAGQTPLPVPFQLAGGAPAEMAQAFTVIVKDQVAASKAIKDSVNDLTMQVGKIHTFFDGGSRRPGMGAPVIDRDDLVSAFREAMFGGGAQPGQQQQGAPSVQPGGQVIPAGADIPRPPFAPSPASSGAVPRLQDMAPPGVRPRPPASPSGGDTYENALGAFGGLGNDHERLFDLLQIRSSLAQNGLNIGSLRQRVAGSLNRHLSEMQIGGDLDQDDSGMFHRPNGEFASRHEVSRFLKGQAIQGVIGKIGEKGLAGGLAESFPAVAAPLGFAAAGIGATYAASNIIASQQAQNAEYQRMLGGSNLEGMRERAKAQMFGFGNRPIFGGTFGGMGSSQAEALYLGATSLGLGDRSGAGGLNRGAALSFGQNNYSKFGMSVEDSLSLVKTAVENGVSSLDSVSDALERVSKTAHDSGVNAEEARKHFANYYEEALKSGIGPNSAVIGGALANMQTGLGPMFQGANFGSLAGSPQQLLMQAQTQGLTRPQYIAAIGQPGGGAVLQGRAMNQTLRPLAARFLGNKALTAIAPIGQKMIEYGEHYQTRNLPSSMWEEASSAAMEAGVDPFIAAQLVQQMTGQQMEPDQALRYLIGVQTGLVDPEQEARDAQSSSKVHGAKLGKGDQAELRNGSFNANRDISDAIGAGKGYSDPGSLKSRGHNRYENRKDYLETVGKSGKRSPIVEALLKNQPHDRRFRVESADGPRVVGLNDALNHYYDQIASGQAEIVQGAGEGQSVADALKMSPDAGAGKALGLDSAATTGRGKALAPGEKWDEWDAKKAKDRAGKADGKIVIEAAPELARILRITASGSASYQDAARNQGVPPPRTTPPVDRHSPGE